MKVKRSLTSQLAHLLTAGEHFSFRRTKRLRVLLLLFDYQREVDKLIRGTFALVYL